MLLLNLEKLSVAVVVHRVVDLPYLLSLLHERRYEQDRGYNVPIVSYYDSHRHYYLFIIISAILSLSPNWRRMSAGVLITCSFLNTAIVYQTYPNKIIWSPLHHFVSLYNYFSLPNHTSRSPIMSINCCYSD